MGRVLALILVGWVTVAATSAETLPFTVIVHRSNPVTSLTRAELSAIYMKRTKSWRGGREIVPIDQPATSRVRERFSRSIHGKSVAFVTRYWQRLIFSGRAIPPQELRSDAAILDFVRANTGAIGYIHAATPRGDDVKVVAVTP